MTGFLISIVPTAGVLFMFWVVLRALIQADRRERAATARLEAEQQARVPATHGGKGALATGEVVPPGASASGERSGDLAARRPADGDLPEAARDDSSQPAAGGGEPKGDVPAPAAVEPGRTPGDDSEPDSGRGAPPDSGSGSSPGDEAR